MKTWFPRVLILPLFAVLGFIIYFPALRAPFFFDDFEFIVNNPLAQDGAALFAQWQTAGLKLFTYITFVCNFIVGGPYPMGYHLVNIILHVYNAWLMWVLAEKIMQAPETKKYLSAPQKEAIAVFAGLLFLVHPVATSAVSYVWQRAELLNAAFYISALIYYVMARQDKRLRYYVAAFLCFLLGLFTKGTIVSLPLMIILLECALWPVSRKKGYAIIFLLGGFFFFKAYLYLWEEPWGTYSKVFPLLFMKTTGTVFSYDQVWTQLVVTVKYSALAIFPLGQQFDYNIPIATSFSESRVWFSAIILIGLLIAAIFAWNKRRLFSVGVVWFLITLLPAALLAGREPMWEYRMYFPLAGLLFGIVALVVQSFDVRKIIYGFLALIVVLGLLTFLRNQLWESPERLLRDNIHKSPQSANSYQLLGTLCLQQGRTEEAEQYLEKTISLAPDAAESYNNLGLIAKNRGDIPKAQQMFEAAIRYRPTLTSAYVNLAYLILGQGHSDKAEELLRQSLQVRETEGAYAGLGKVYLASGRLEEAEKFLNKALAINPQASTAYFWYGQLWLARQNQERARAMFLQAVRFNSSLSGQVPQF